MPTNMSTGRVHRAPCEGVPVLSSCPALILELNSCGLVEPNRLRGPAAANWTSDVYTTPSAASATPKPASGKPLTSSLPIIEARSSVRCTTPLILLSRNGAEEGPKPVNEEMRRKEAHLLDGARCRTRTEPFSHFLSQSLALSGHPMNTKSARRTWIIKEPRKDTSVGGMSEPFFL